MNNTDIDIRSAISFNYQIFVRTVHSDVYSAINSNVHLTVDSDVCLAIAREVDSAVPAIIMEQGMLLSLYE